MVFDLFKEWIQSINVKDRNLFKENIDIESVEKEYPSFMILRALSQSEDTVAIANMVNTRANTMTPRMQYDFLFNMVPKKKRFAKWAKGEKSEEIALIQEAYNYSRVKAELALELLSDKDIANIKAWLDTGGKK